jgi:hypothetical protein
MTFLPLWMEILVNVIGYAGFIGIATWHGGKRPSILNSDAPRFAAEPSSRGLWPALTSDTKKPARMNGRAIPNSA